MAFSGTYELESQENYEEFLEAIGTLVLLLTCCFYEFFHLKWSWPVMLLVNQPDWLPVTGLLSAKTDHKVTTEVVQDGNDFTWTQSIPNWSWSNKFKVGQECELVTMKGIKFKVSRRQSAGTGCWAVALIQPVGVWVGISPCCGSPVGSSFYGRRENFRSFSSVPLHRRDHWQ